MKLALALSRSGLLLLVDQARPALLGELVRGLLPGNPELEVYTDVRRMLDVPHGATLVLVPRSEDADWLNLNRPLFSERELKVVLFCERDVTVTLARHAVDFIDWTSHRVECPDRPPAFAVAGLRMALAARAPGIVWKGGDLRDLEAWAAWKTEAGPSLPASSPALAAEVLLRSHDAPSRPWDLLSRLALLPGDGETAETWRTHGVTSSAAR